MIRFGGWSTVCPAPLPLTQLGLVRALLDPLDTAMRESKNASDSAARSLNEQVVEEVMRLACALLDCAPAPHYASARRAHASAAAIPSASSAGTTASTMVRA